MLHTGLSPLLGNSDKDTLCKVKNNKWQPWESSTKIQKSIRSIIEMCFLRDPESRPTVEQIIDSVKNVRCNTSDTIDAKRVKYLFLRQRYQRKRVSSNASHEPRRIYDIVNAIDENSTWMTKRVSTTLLSDSSDTEDDNEEEEMIAELKYLKNEVDHMDGMEVPDISITAPTPMGSNVSLNTSASDKTAVEKRKHFLRSFFSAVSKSWHFAHTGSKPDAHPRCMFSLLFFNL